MYQDQMRVESYYPGDAGWNLVTLTRKQDRLGVPASMFEMTLAEVCAGVEPLPV